MRRTPLAPCLLPPCVAVLLFAVPVVRAGTVALAWDPVDHPDLAGYRVYYGPSGAPLGDSTGLTPATTVTLSGLQDCTEYTVGVKAVDDQGGESVDFSNLVDGWPRPVVTAATPATIEQGTTTAVVLSGTNFRAGSTVLFDDPAISATVVGGDGCQQLTLSVSVGSGGALGPVSLRVVQPDQVYGEAVGLLGVAADDSGPTISNLAADPVGATTATIVWSTDEPADGQVFFREAGQSTYQSSAPSPDLVTEHAIGLTGLLPETDYEFYVVSADSSGNAQASAVATFTTGASPHEYLRFEAEAGDTAGPLGEAAGGGVFADAWIALDAHASAGSVSDPSGTKAYGVWLPHGGNWRLWVRVRSAGSPGPTWVARVDGGPWAPLGETTTAGAWTWVAGGSHALGPGQHTLALGGLEAGSAADRVIVTDDPAFVPTEQPGDDTTPPAAPPAADATPGNGSTLLTWTAPADGDASTLVIRFRSDGPFPTSPVDGQLLHEQGIEPGSSGGTVHDGQVNGTTYAYALFVVDPSENASEPAEVLATPAAQPPPTVTNLRRTDKQ